MTYMIERSALYLHWLEQETPRIPKTVFSKRTKKEILTATKMQPDGIAQSLISELEGVVARHQERNEFEAKLSTAQPLGKKIRQLNTAIKQVHLAAKVLDWQTRRELGASLTGNRTTSINIHHEAKPPELVEFEEKICSASDTLESISKAIVDTLSHTPKSRGGAKRKDRLDFVLEIAERTHSIAKGDIPISGTRNGAFAQLVFICLRELEGGETQDIHSLIRKAVMTYRRSAPPQRGKNLA